MLSLNVPKNVNCSVYHIGNVYLLSVLHILLFVCKGTTYRPAKVHLTNKYVFFIFIA